MNSNKQSDPKTERQGLNDHLIVGWGLGPFGVKLLLVFTGLSSAVGAFLGGGSATLIDWSHIFENLVMNPTEMLLLSIVLAAGMFAVVVVARLAFGVEMQGNIIQTLAKSEIEELKAARQTMKHKRR
jgi:hypothetical protein